MTSGVRRGPDPEDPSFERVTLASDDGVEAAFVPGAGMVGVSMTLDGVELLARRHGLAGYLGRGSTFGIPLLAPWANRLAAPHQVVGAVAWDVRVGDPGVHPDEFGQPIHGLSAGAREWEVEDVRADAGGCPAARPAAGRRAARPVRRVPVRPRPRRRRRALRAHAAHRDRAHGHR